MKSLRNVRDVLSPWNEKIALSCALRTEVPPSIVERGMTDGASQRAQIAELYTKHGHLVVSRCRYLLRDEDLAQDAAQEVFVKVMRSWDSFRHDSSPATWIIKIATNHCLNLIASSKAKWRDRFKEYVKHQNEGAMLAGADPELARLVHQLLEKVDRETQQVAIHYYVDEMTQEEIATALGRSLPTIRKRLSKFKRVARRELDHESSR